MSTAKIPTTPKTLAWPTGQQDRVRARITAHREADEIIQGAGWTKDGKGCAIGCSLDSYDPVVYAHTLGIPLTIAYLVDAIHDGLPWQLSLDWPTRVAEALQPGMDTTYAWPRFVIRLLGEECKTDIGGAVVRLYERHIAGDEPSMEDWKEVSGTAARIWKTAWRTARESAKATDIAKEAERDLCIARAAEVAANIGKFLGEADTVGDWEAADAAVDAIREVEEIVPFQRQADILLEVLATSPIPSK